MAAAIKIVAVFVLSSVSIAHGDWSSIVSRLYKKPAQNNRPLVLIFDNSRNNKPSKYQESSYNNADRASSSSSKYLESLIRHTHSDSPSKHILRSDNDEPYRNNYSPNRYDNGDREHRGYGNNRYNREASHHQHYANYRDRDSRESRHISKHSHNLNRENHYPYRPSQYVNKDYHSHSDRGDRYDDRQRTVRAPRIQSYSSREDRVYNKSPYNNRYEERYPRAESPKYRHDNDRYRPYNRDRYRSSYDGYWQDKHIGRENPNAVAPAPKKVRSPVVKSLLRISNSIRCDAKDECQNECEPKEDDCEAKCEEKFECEPEKEVEECERDECAQSEEDQNPSTKGIPLEPEPGEKCKRCKKK